MHTKIPYSNLCHKAKPLLILLHIIQTLESDPIQLPICLLTLFSLYIQHTSFSKMNTIVHKGRQNTKMQVREMSKLKHKFAKVCKGLLETP